jgi:meso-butanediol dehydrogenase/(S,S)-butanediol dehydrogenase/diacetyl reductase
MPHRSRNAKEEGMAGRLDGKVVLITGTGGGQGRAAAHLFCAEGGRVVGCDLNAAENARTVEPVNEAGGEMVGMAPVDLGDSRQARQWVADAAAVYGRIDVLFNNAAAPRFAPFAELSDEDWHSTIRNELDLVFVTTQAAWPHLVASGGAIVNTASVQAHVGIAMNGGFAHAAAKGGGGRDDAPVGGRGRAPRHPRQLHQPGNHRRPRHGQDLRRR